MSNVFFVVASLLGALSVGLGAFGAHALRSRIHPRRLDNFETGVRYQMYHALALIATAVALTWQPDNTLLQIAGWAFMAGIALFSGSLYILAFTNQRQWGAVAPIGGLALIIGWVLLAIGVV